MARKKPNLDSFIVPVGESVELSVEYPGPGPVGAKVLVNGNLDAATSLHPSKREFSIDFPAEEPGDYLIKIVIEGAKPGELAKLNSGKIEHPEEEIRAKAEWNVLAAEPDELYQNEREKLKQLVHDALALYAAGSIAFEACKRLWEYLEDIPDEEREEITTLDDFVGIENGGDVTQEEGKVENNDLEDDEAVSE